MSNYGYIKKPWCAQVECCEHSSCVPEYILPSWKSKNRDGRQTYSSEGVLKIPAKYKFLSSNAQEKSKAADRPSPKCIRKQESAAIDRVVENMSKLRIIVIEPSEW